MKAKLFVQPGQQFDRLTVVDPETRKNETRAALCSCVCGTQGVLVFIKHLVHGRVRSCGCIKREQTAERNRTSASRDGATKHPLFSTWAGMINRCYSPAAGNYQYYGGRGIEVCAEWRTDPWVFITYVERELGPKPSQKHSIDRVHPDDDYGPGKVRWADPVEQARNRRPRGGARI